MRSAGTWNLVLAFVMWLVSINKALLYFCAVLFFFKDWQKDNIVF